MGTFNNINYATGRQSSGGQTRALSGVSGAAGH